MRLFAKTELLGPQLQGAPPAIDTSEEPAPIAATGTFTGWLTAFGLLALGASVATWVASRKLGRARGASIVGMVLMLGANLLTFGSPARAQQIRRIVATVDSKVNDLVINAGVVEILRIAEVRVLAVTEASGLTKGAKANVTRTIRGVKVLGQDMGDASVDRINQALAPTGLSIASGPQQSTSTDDGTSASIDAVGFTIEQKMVVPGVGGVQTPEYRLTLGRATPSVSFYSFSFGSFDEAPFVGDVGDLTGGQDYTDTGFTEPSATTAFPRQVAGAPGVTQVGPGKFLIEGKFAGLDFGGMSLRLWPLKDIAEAAGGALLLVGLIAAVRHRRRFA